MTSTNKPVVNGLLTGDCITGLFQQYETKTVGTGKKLLVKASYAVQGGNGGDNDIVTGQQRRCDYRALIFVYLRNHTL